MEIHILMNIRFKEGIRIINFPRIVNGYLNARYTNRATFGDVFPLIINVVLNIASIEILPMTLGGCAEYRNFSGANVSTVRNRFARLIYCFTLQQNRIQTLNRNETQQKKCTDIILYYIKYH